MLLFATYFIIVFVLLIINSIPVFGSKRTKRFARLPSLFFLILFAAFGVGRILSFLYYDVNGTKQRALDTSYDVQNVRGKMSTTGTLKNDFESENMAVSKQKIFNDNVAIVLKLAYMQALFVVLLSYLGMKKYEKRYLYYKRKITVHAVFFVFCVILDAFVF